MIRTREIIARGDKFDSMGERRSIMQHSIGHRPVGGGTRESRRRRVAPSVNSVDFGQHSTALKVARSALMLDRIFTLYTTSSEH